MNDKNKTYSKQVIEIADYMFANPDKKMSDILSYFVVFCRKNKRTIERYIKQAKEYNKTRIQKQEEAKENVLIKEAKESVKLSILTRNESLEILSNKAKCKAREVPIESEMINGEKVYTKWRIKYPSDTDQIKAIQQLSKMEGWEAPVKTDVTYITQKSIYE
jgi:hypothetical protein